MPDDNGNHFHGGGDVKDDICQIQKAHFYTHILKSF